MRVPEKIIRCIIMVGENGVPNPIPAMWAVADHETRGVASEVHPHSACCSDCKDVMPDGELFGRDLKKLACPNCYSSNICLTAVCFELGYATVASGSLSDQEGKN